MWSDWLPFCVCGFHSVCPSTEKDKRLMEVFWWERLRGKQSCSDGQGHIQQIFNPIFHWWVGLCSLPVVWPKAKPGLLYSVPLTPWQPTVDLGLCWRLLDTLRQVWLSLCWGHKSFLLGDELKVLFVSSKSLFLQSCGSSVIKSHWPSGQSPWGFSLPLLDSQIGKCGP